MTGTAARAYYNEIDPAAVAVLRQLIADGVIAPGDVDTRSIKDVQADDLRGYTQCHLFAGGGLWSVAARMAGWPDWRPLWSASCPCQPFSAAGRGLGTDDPRHLWPHLFRLVRDASAAGFGPPVLVGEQVAGAAGYGWLDGVRADLAGEDYASRAVDIPACAVDAPHQRNRLYWIACRRLLSDDAGISASAWDGDDGRRPEQDRPATAADGAGAAGVGFVGDDPCGSGPGSREHQAHHGQSGRRKPRGPDGRNGSAWADAEWLICHDGKARRAKSGIRLLVDGIPGRVDLWRVGGNAIVPVLAAEVLGAYLEATEMRLAS